MPIGYLLVFLAATLWGTIGLFFTYLHSAGMGALTIGFLRSAMAGLMLAAMLGTRKRASLHLPPGSWPFFALFGLLGVALFYLLGVEAVLLTNVPTASVMLYSAPLWVTLVTWRVWGEALTTRKIVALVLAFFGVILVARLNDPAQLALNPAGTLVAIGSGVAYAGYTLFSKYAVRHYATGATVIYSLVFGACFLAVPLLVPPSDLTFWSLAARHELVGAGFAPLVQGLGPWLALLGLALGPTLGSYMLYNTALTRVPASNASIVAMIEPAVAALLGWLVLGQGLDAGQWLGAALVLSGAAILALSARSAQSARGERGR